MSYLFFITLQKYSHIMNRILRVSLIMAFMAVLASCGSYKRTAYLQDMKVDETYIVQDRPETVISVGDKLSIVVTCKNPALAAPFNAGNSYYTNTESTGGVSVQTPQEEEKGYLVDKNGDIDFPVLGKINVAGTTLNDLKLEIERLLKEKPYIQDPLVFVEFLNFQITMLGHIKAGNYIFKSGNVTLLEALAEAQDIEQTGVIKDVWVIRTVRGQRKLYTVNMKSKSLYDSPVYYLQQNDLIYVKPKNNLIDQDISSILSMVGIGISFLTLISTIMLLTKNL